MSKDRWTEYSATATAARNGVSVRHKTLGNCRNRGIRVWGALDYLINHCGYVWQPTQQEQMYRPRESKRGVAGATR